MTEYRIYRNPLYDEPTEDICTIDTLPEELASCKPLLAQMEFRMLELKLGTTLYLIFTNKVPDVVDALIA